MRILHTSDWHLGKKLFKLDRTPEHELFLDWLMETLKSEKIDLLIIAGDVFDSPTPPHQSLELFYQFLHRVSSQTQTETLIIAGNHDSGLLIEAPAKLLAPHRVRVWGKLNDPTHHWRRITVGSESLDVCAIPFFRSYELLPQGEGDALEALKKYLLKDRTHPQLLILHHLAGMFEAAGSEQVISLSGVDSIPTEILKAFDYVALGHIHKPQRIGDQMYYSGSPIPLRFSETKEKSVVLIDVREGKLTSTLKLIPVFRKLHIVKADEESWREKLTNLETSEGLTPMVEVQLKLASPQLGLIDEIKSILEKKKMELLSYLPMFVGQEKKENHLKDLFDLSPMDLFEEFYAAKYPDAQDIPEELKQDFKALYDKVKHASPEA
jgi:DNA repair protein SbcD/Mre11